jgi:hypothetical protein
MFKVFVSYSTADIRNVEDLKSQISDSGVAVFVADRSVQPGQSLPEEIKQAITDCDVFILLWSPTAKTSGWVPQEIGIALGLGKPIIPLMLEEGEPLTGFITGIKYIKVYENKQLAFEEARAMVLEGVEKKRKSGEKQQQNEALFFIAIGGVLLWALTQG